MKIQSVQAAYFSPTGTTQAVVRNIADGINPALVNLIDVTSPDARKKPLHTSEDEVLIIGVPVYMGRVPALLGAWLNSLQARNTPTVCVVVYGNRAYEDALLELKDIVTSRGCVPIAGAAFIGEHSFADSSTPVALGRPDATDLALARELGGKIRAKLDAASDMARVSEVVVPGERPYGRSNTLWDVDFIAVGQECIQCGLCAEVCPMGAIDPDNSARIDRVKCISCCACIKKCPQHARSIKPSPVREAQQRLRTNCAEPKQPEYFV